ncbi:hypothetical protein M9H77_18923 [Catharanthus roseus]|uniref:Uncharacterized protein n=1 Tax=Catharanthus roseus TaxID=4058 RepID=A0ACC0B8X6_CATRO|nr:hypothetical protein M9H77_18923 [Catharanthus roseus]
MKASPPKKLGKMVMEKWRKKKKGQFVIYTKDGERFVVPLCYLSHPIFKVLLEMAEEEYGPTIHGRLEVPCEKELMEYILSLLKKKPPVDVEKALLNVTTCKGASSDASVQNQGSIQTALLSYS